jgi:DNA-binding NarL/FixJ family response regulator
MTATVESITPVFGEVAAVTRKLKVWLVDDNDRLRSLVGELLGYEADIECARQFSSPDQLLSTLASHPGPDVILLDVQMGDRNGLDAVRPIKSLTPSTRVLMFTTCFNPEWRERALSEGASDYLLKTDTLKKVAARIRCPAGDADRSKYPRRRANYVNSKLGSQATADSPKTSKPWSLSRTLGRLLAFWN